MLALPGATNQDTTQNEIINDLISLNFDYINGQNNLNNLNMNKNRKRKEPLPCYIVKGSINTGTYKLAVAFVYLDAINWLKNKTCRPTNDSWHFLNKAGENGKLPSLDIPSATACFHLYNQAAHRPDKRAVTDTMTNPFPVKYVNFRYLTRAQNASLLLAGDWSRSPLKGLVSLVQ